MDYYVKYSSEENATMARLLLPYTMSSGFSLALFGLFTIPVSGSKYFIPTDKNMEQAAANGDLKVFGLYAEEKQQSQPTNVAVKLETVESKLIEQVALGFHDTPQEFKLRIVDGKEVIICPCGKIEIKNAQLFEAPEGTDFLRSGSFKPKDVVKPSHSALFWATVQATNDAEANAKQVMDYKEITARLTVRTRESYYVGV